jgi:hypothetical protein
VPGSKLLAERRGAVTILTIDRADVRNAIDAETASMLTDAIETFSRDDGARVLVMTGNGGEAFCAGADLGDIEGLVERPGREETGPLGFSGLEPAKPRLAAIEGYCVGGGVEPACWCHIRIAVAERHPSDPEPGDGSRERGGRARVASGGGAAARGGPGRGRGIRSGDGGGRAPLPRWEGAAGGIGKTAGPGFDAPRGPTSDGRQHTAGP